jgi:hypothetical protein
MVTCRKTSRKTSRKTLCKKYCKTQPNNSFFIKITEEWKKQTNGGNVQMDVGNFYTCDFYMTTTIHTSYFNHVHLVRIIKRPKYLSKSHVPGYCLKKMDKNGKFVHSKMYIINEKDSPRKIVATMLKLYKKFVPNVI